MIGAGKAGTTALWSWLREHPQIYLSRIKEPRYFADDMPGLMMRIASEAEYLALFNEAGPEHLAIGEASTQYIFSANAVSNIRVFNPAARLVVTLRNPVDMAPSAHGEFCHWFLEDELDFETAWRKFLFRRLHDLPDPPSWRFAGPWPEMCLLSKSVAKTLAVFPRENIHFVFYDDIVENPLMVYRDLLSFLDVSLDERSEFPVVNANKRFRSRWLGRLMQQPPPLLHALKNRLEGLPVFDRIWFRLQRMNIFYAPRPPIRDAFRTELVEYFRADVVQLQELTGRDLAHWHH